MSLRRTCALLGVVECDTLEIEWEGHRRLARLMDVNPERATPGGSQPASEFGRRTLRWVRETYLKGVAEVELEFPHDDIQLSNSGKLLCYVHARGENFNVRLVRDGWSPCFEKYGHPLVHRGEMERAELWARLEGRGIWGGLSTRRDYAALKTYWRIRAAQVACYRQATAMGEDILSCRLDYDDIVTRARTGTSAQVLADLRRAFHASDGAVLIQLGNPMQPLVAFLPPHARALAGFLEREFVGFGKPNYLYFNGDMSMDGDRPQIGIERLDQVATAPVMTVTTQP